MPEQSPPADVREEFLAALEAEADARTGELATAFSEREAREAKDASGHEHAADGKFGTGGGSAGGSDAGHAEKKKHVLSAVLGKGADLKASAKAAAGRVGDAVWNRMPPKAQKAAAKLYAVGKAVEHKAMTGFAKGKELAIAVAKERGLTPEHAEKVGRLLAVADQVSAWTVNFPATVAVTGSVTAGKVASFLPVASAAYVAYSTARDPFATIRAAKSVFGSKARTHEGAMSKDAAGLLSEALAKNGGSEWYLALVHAALDETQDLAEAVALADQAFAADPDGPDCARP